MLSGTIISNEIVTFRKKQLKNPNKNEKQNITITIKIKRKRMNSTIPKTNIVRIEDSNPKQKEKQKEKQKKTNIPKSKNEKLIKIKPVKPVSVAIHDTQIKNHTSFLSEFMERKDVLDTTIVNLYEESRRFDIYFKSAFTDLQKSQNDLKSVFKKNKDTQSYCEQYELILSQKSVVEKEIKTYTFQKRKVLENILVTKDAIGLHTFVRKMKLDMDNSKTSSKIDIYRIRKLPDELIRIIREYIPFEVRFQVVNSEFDVIKHCYQMKDRTNIVNVLSQNNRVKNILDSKFPELSEIITRPMFSIANSEIHGFVKAPRSQYAIRFESIMMAVKYTCPRLAIKIINTLKQLDANSLPILDFEL
jgi:hypothetical protein